MKKLLACIMTVLVLLTVNPVQSIASEIKSTPTLSPAASADADAAKVKLMETRLNEIDAMDKSNLTSSEKKSLRKEVRTIKRDIKEVGGGVYVSVGALLIIIILLIVLL